MRVLGASLRLVRSPRIRLLIKWWSGRLILAGKYTAFMFTPMAVVRYFVLRLSDGSGHHAYLGVGFEDRNDAFDFNA